jgi:hypothetical protein
VSAAIVVRVVTVVAAIVQAVVQAAHAHNVKVVAVAKATATNRIEKAGFIAGFFFNFFLLAGAFPGADFFRT